MSGEIFSRNWINGKSTTDGSWSGNLITRSHAIPAIAAIYRFSMEQMYAVVSDVSNYNKFVPFCKKSIVVSENQKCLVAELQIGFPPVYESYTSNVKLRKPTMVRAVCSDGKIFSYLETCWKFSPGLRSNPLSCIVDFTIEFEFKSKLHYQLANMFFEALVRQMEGAFLSEAKKRFGRESIPTHKLAYVKS